MMMRWSNEDVSVDDIDPGKDIFALLFMCFFLINAIFLCCNLSTGEKTVHVSAAEEKGSTQLPLDSLASIEVDGEHLYLIQKGVRFALPDDLDRLRNEGLFESGKDEQGEPFSRIFVRNPGSSVAAGDMINVVRILHRAKIGVDFRTVKERK